jgi:hypothetical protein
VNGGINQRNLAVALALVSLLGGAVLTLGGQWLTAGRGTATDIKADIERTNARVAVIEKLAAERGSILQNLPDRVAGLERTQQERGPQIRQLQTDTLKIQADYTQILVHLAQIELDLQEIRLTLKIPRGAPGRRSSVDEP